MKPLSVARRIEAPRERVFEAATDIQSWPARIGGIERVEVLTPGPFGKGTRFRETRIMFGREATEEMVVSDFEPGRSYVLIAESHGCRYRSAMRFDDDGPGATRVEMTFEATPLTTGAKVMGAVMGPMMKGTMCKMIAKDIEDLGASLGREAGA